MNGTCSVSESLRWPCLCKRIVRDTGCHRFQDRVTGFLEIARANAEDIERSCRFKDVDLEKEEDRHLIEVKVNESHRSVNPKVSKAATLHADAIYMRSMMPKTIFATLCMFTKRCTSCMQDLRQRIKHLVYGHDRSVAALKSEADAAAASTLAASSRRLNEDQAERATIKAFSREQASILSTQVFRLSDHI
jgi:hypothetical protein